MSGVPRALTLLAQLLVSITMLACASPRAVSRPSMTVLTTTHRDYQLLESRLAGAYRDMANRNIDRLMQLYSADALIQSAGQPAIAGPSAIRAFWLETFDQYQLELTPELQEVAALGDALVARGRVVGVLRPRLAAVAVPIDSWFMQIYRRQADGTLLFWRGTNGPNPR